MQGTVLTTEPPRPRVVIAVQLIRGICVCADIADLQNLLRRQCKMPLLLTVKGDQMQPKTTHDLFSYSEEELLSVNSKDTIAAGQ